MGTTSESCWSKRSKCERKLIRILIVVATLLITSLILIIYLFTYLLSNASPLMGSLSQETVVTTASVIEKIDFDVNPCDDFYQFACGNFLKSTETPENDIIISRRINKQLKSVLEAPIRQDEQRHFQLVKKAYKACLANEKNVKTNLRTAKELLESLGDWPVLRNGDWDENEFDLFDVQYRLREIGLNFQVFLGVMVEVDLKNTSKYIITVASPEFEIAPEYLKMNFNTKQIQNYYNYMVDIAVMFGARRQIAKEQLKDSLLFEMTLGNYTMPKEEERNFSNTHNVMKIHELEKVFPEIPWLVYLTNLMSSSIILTPEEEIQVKDLKYLRKSLALLENTNKRVLANYVMWKQVNIFVDYLSEEFWMKKLDMKGVLKKVEVESKGWEQCVLDITRSLPILAGALYVRNYVNQDVRNGVTDIVNYVRESFKQNVNELDWMDEKTRKNALAKIDTMFQVVGYPDELLDDEKLAKYFATLDVNEYDNLYTDLNISIFQTTFAFEQLRKPHNKHYWVDLSNVLEVNAYYDLTKNSILLPAAILQGHYFNKNLRYYMNFAVMGTTIGHEIIHSLDDEGSQFDENGNLNNWWEEITKEAFLNKTNCIIEQFNSYKIPDLNLTVDGFNTQSENIADNGGIKLAYLAYEKWTARHGEEDGLPGLNYTSKQLFWIYAAQDWCTKIEPEDLEVQVKTDEHAPNEFRVIGPFSNQKHFGEDFKCPKGSKMNPEEKCSVW